MGSMALYPSPASRPVTVWGQWMKAGLSILHTCEPAHGCEASALRIGPIQCVSQTRFQ